MLDILLISFALAMDSFSVSICAGASLSNPGYKKPLLVAFYFGFFQALMTFLGVVGSELVAGQIGGFDHWIAFLLLLFIGGNMIFSFLKKEEDCHFSFSHRNLFMLAIATSIDAIGVGVSLSLITQRIVIAFISIGLVSFILSFLGVRIGKILNKYINGYGELVGGFILLFIGFRILYEHGVF